MKLVDAIKEGSFTLKMFKSNELPSSVNYEEGKLIINNYITAFGSGKKTVVSGWFSTTTGTSYEISNLDIQQLKIKLLKWCGATTTIKDRKKGVFCNSDLHKLHNLRKELTQIARSVDFNHSDMEALQKCYTTLYKMLCDKELADKKAFNNASLLARASEKMRGVDVSLLTKEQQAAYKVLFGTL